MRRFFGILFRYSILVLTAIPNLYIFYFIFSPLTIYPAYFLLNLFFGASLNGNAINIAGSSIKLINACIAGSAYYLLLILNLSTPQIKISKRLGIIMFSFFSFLIVNVLRIFLLSIFFISGYSWFDEAHKLFWYFGSFFFIILIWFSEVKLFNLTETPFYSDMKYLYKKIVTQ